MLIKVLTLTVKKRLALLLQSDLSINTTLGSGHNGLSEQLVLIYKKTVFHIFLVQKLFFKIVMNLMLG